jgi:large subunit ribosomal protein L29
MKPNEVRNLTLDEIEAEVAQRRAELLDLRFQAAVGQASNPRRIREAKREIARLLTVANETRARNGSQA